MVNVNFCWRTMFLASALSMAHVQMSVQALAQTQTHEAPGTLSLWYNQPGKSAINDGLPIGNGRVGGLMLGGVNERFQFNEDSLWTGDGNPSGDYNTMGGYQNFGDLLLTFEATAGRVEPVISDYRRELDLGTATVRTSFTRDGLAYVREAFASAPAHVVVLRWSSPSAGAVSGTIALHGAHGETTAAEGAVLTFGGALNNGLRYEARAQVVAHGGKAEAAGGVIRLKNCDSVEIVLAAGTNYAMDAAKNYRGEDPQARLAAQVAAAARQPYQLLKAEQLKDFGNIFNRVQVDFGRSSDAQRALPTDQRKLEASKTMDPELEALQFQYGRYLLIACSRPGGLPANLQGLWNDSNTPAWHSDYHANINIQMNYWPAEVANMPETHLPFFDLVSSQLPAWRLATDLSPDFKTNAGAMNSRGFAIRTSHNIFGGMGWNWDKTANAWYCQHLWEHYAFGGDKNFLKTVAYPIMKETTEFWEDHLKTLPDGRMVVPNGWSPEHGPTEDGVSYNQQIVWDLFNNYVEASAALGIDAAYAARVAGLRDKLVGPQIGKWGQLQEWMTDRDGPADHHRHTSHLFGVFPGRQISVLKTPSLAAAAMNSLVARSDEGDVREWSFAWRTALYARLHDGEAAHRQFQQLFSARNTCINLFGLHPPMQMDGDFGITAGVAEMLLQSHEGEINLLPALPTAWPGGSVSGLRARGGFEVDIAWAEGRLTTATIRGTAGRAGRLRYGTSARAFILGKDGSFVFKPK